MYCCSCFWPPLLPLSPCLRTHLTHLSLSVSHIRFSCSNLHTRLHLASFWLLRSFSLPHSALSLFSSCYTSLFLLFSLSLSALVSYFYSLSYTHYLYLSFSSSSSRALFPFPPSATRSQSPLPFTLSPLLLHFSPSFSFMLLASLSLPLIRLVPLPSSQTQPHTACPLYHTHTHTYLLPCFTLLPYLAHSLPTPSPLWPPAPVPSSFLSPSVYACL